MSFHVNYLGLCPRNPVGFGHCVRKLAINVARPATKNVYLGICDLSPLLSNE